MGNLRHKTLTAFVIAAPLAFTACAEAEPVDPGEFDVIERSGWLPDYPGNGDLSIHVGPTTAIPDCLAWEIQNGDVFDGTDPNLPVVISVTDDTIFDDAGNITCTREGLELSDQMRRDGDDAVVFTTIGRWVFEGDLWYPTWPFSFHELIAFKIQLAQKLRFTVKGDQIFEGKAHPDNVLATSTEHIQFANPMRKLVFASLIDAECGGNGLPPLPE